MKRDYTTAEGIQYCTHCGGSGEIRVGITGNPKLDYQKCPSCNGLGEHPRMLNVTTRIILQKTTLL